MQNQIMRKRFEQMKNDINDYYDLWLLSNDFEEKVPEEMKRQYFERIFPSLAQKFLQRRTNPTQNLITAEIIDRFMLYCQQLEQPHKKRKKTLDEVMHKLFPRKYLIGKLAKFLDSPEEYFPHIAKLEEDLRKNRTQQHFESREAMMRLQQKPQ